MFKRNQMGKPTRFRELLAMTPEQLEAEYKLIQAKKSNKSRWMRDMITIVVDQRRLHKDEEE